MREPEIGELRHVAVFKRPVRTENPSTGEMEITSYTTLNTLRAAFDQDYVRDAEQVQADQVQGQTAARIKTRYFAGVTQDDMVTLDSVNWEIKAVENWRNLDIWLICTVVTMGKAS